MDVTVNPQGNESPAPINVEAAFDDYLKRQASPAGSQDGEGAPAEGADNGQPAGEADPAAQADAEEQRFKVKVNGEEREIPLSELVKGYQLETDYRIKTSQAAEQARAAQAQLAQAQAMQAQYAQQLQAYQQRLMQMQPAAPDPALIASDPVAFLQQQQAYQGWQQQLQASQWEAQQLQAQQEAQRQQQTQAYLSEQSQLLLQALPEWSDAAKAQAGKEALSSFLQKAGFSAEEIGGVQDHRQVVLAHKAMLYDQMMARQAQATSKVASLPPKAPQRPGSGVSPTDGRTRAVQALKSSGSVEDAAHVFAAMLGGR